MTKMFDAIWFLYASMTYINDVILENIMYNPDIQFKKNIVIFCEWIIK